MNSANEVLKTLISRRSIKKFSPEQIKDEELGDILEAGLYAPNGRGLQSSMMVVIQDKDTIARLSRMNADIMGVSSDPFYGAPTVVVVFADSAVNTYVEDGSLTCGNMLNAAAALGVGGCWIHRARPMFESDEGRRLMQRWGVPEGYVGIANCVFGYAAGVPKPQPARREGRVIYVR